jgi:uncharacterized protein (TIGR02284 family)
MDTQVLSQQKIIDELNEVLQIDIDAVGAYQTAIDSINDFEIKRQLLQFKTDHERHVTDLNGLVLRFGGDPHKRPDLRGVVRKGFTKVAGLVGIEATLRAMLSNERLTNDVYSRHVGKPFPPDVLEVLRRNYGDEQRHFAWIETALRQRLWEHAAPTPTT